MTHEKASTTGVANLIQAAMVSSGILIADAYVQTGVNVAVAYVAAIWLVHKSERKHWIWIAAAICSLLVAIGFVLSPASTEPFAVLANRGLALVAIVVTAAICVRNVAILTLQRIDERLLLTTLANLNDAVISTDRDGRITRINTAAERLTGWTDEEAAGKPIEEVCKLVDAKKREAAKSPYERAMRDGPFVGKRSENMVVHKDGSARRVRESAAPINSIGQGIGCIITLHDDEERKRVQRLLGQTQTRFRSILEAGQAGTWFWDIRSNRFLVDEYLATLFSVDRHRATSVGLPLEDFLLAIHSDDRPEVERLIRDALGSGKNYEAEHRLVQSDGTSRWVSARGSVERDDAGKPSKFFGVVIDVTARKESEDALRRHSETFTRFVDESPFGIFVVDSEFRIIRVSEGAKPAFRNVDPLIGRDFGEAIRIIWPEPLASEVITIFRDTLETGDPYRSPGLVEQRSDLRTIESYEWEIHRVLLPDGQHGVVCYFFDTTKLRETERALRESEEKAQQANRAKSEFLANMSHEIRTPMSAILGHADVLLDHLSDPDNRQCVSTIKRNGNHLLDIINDILDLSRIEAGKLESDVGTCDLQQLLADLESLMRIRVEGGSCEFRVVPCGKLPLTIETDEKRLRQVLINLIGNAIKFTEEGYVEVRTELLPDVAAPSIRFEIEDTGIGIEPDKLSNLFQPFSQADNSITRNFGGSGLGLAICRRLTEMLGGALDVKSVLGEGSTFSVTVPTGALDRATLGNITIETAKTNEKASRVIDSLSCRVLLVDDRRDVRYVAQHFLEEAGATVKIAEDGAIGINEVEEAERRGEQFDVLVMDMQMPNVDGYTAASKLRSAGFEMPIIALTAAAMEGDREKCLNAGCDDYLSKPIDHAMLVGKVLRMTQDVSLSELRAERGKRREAFRTACGESQN